MIDILCTASMFQLLISTWLRFRREKQDLGDRRLLDTKHDVAVDLVLLGTRRHLEIVNIRLRLVEMNLQKLGSLRNPLALDTPPTARDDSAWHLPTPTASHLSRYMLHCMYIHSIATLRDTRLVSISFRPGLLTVQACSPSYLSTGAAVFDKTFSAAAPHR
ncbi:hypothetical protein BT67DRAFT_130835 [Trichocladium antarcticum]|uniref:Uncharacterized protein n=1 Tax=Trichocladium antarcticum TaxID=1450529 RepID=A0AAN6USF5_9PEZI|nr:hypothetical protein BT67DRAFT_130835 [Trichocladium antarcticum]